MNPISTTELHTMAVRVFPSEEARAQAQAQGEIGSNDLVLTPDTGASLYTQMTEATAAAQAAAQRAQDLSDEMEEALTDGALQGPQGPAGADGADGATFIPSVSEAGLLSWSNDKGLTNPAAVNIRGPQGPAGSAGVDGADGADGTNGADGATFTPSVSEAGLLSWTNDKGLANPAAVNIRGPQGPAGSAGADGADGADGANGADGATFTPSVSEAGLLSWTNDKELTNPAPVNIRGPQGEAGPQGPAAIVSTASGTLSSSQWLDGTQSIAVPGVTANSNVIVSPAPESFTAYSAAGLRATTLLSGYVAFGYDTLPTTDITVYVMVMHGGSST